MAALITITGTAGHDILLSDGPFSFLGEVIFGLEGDDLIRVHGGNDTVFGGAGNDRFEDVAGPRGGSGNDSFYGGAGNDRFGSGDGADLLDGGSGIDTADYAGSTAGVVVNLMAAVQQGGHAEGDRLVGIENVIGSAFADVLTGDAGNNVLFGGGGNDRLHGAAGHDTLDGGAGQDTLLGGTGNDRLSGGTGNDRLMGEAGDDRLDGGSGDDLLEGGAGNDRLSGGTGRDLIDGGAGADILSGGAGADSFRFLSAAESTPGAADRITDFEQGLDRIDLSGLGIDLFTIAVGATETVVSADTSGDGIADFALILDGRFLLNNADFIF
jgi:Ca2+-binding RTX toxin-like protein